MWLLREAGDWQGGRWRGRKGPQQEWALTGEWLFAVHWLLARADHPSSTANQTVLIQPSTTRAVLRKEQERKWKSSKDTYDNCTTGIAMPHHQLGMQLGTRWHQPHQPLLICLLPIAWIIWIINRSQANTACTPVTSHSLSIWATRKLLQCCR